MEQLQNFTPNQLPKEKIVGIEKILRENEMEDPEGTMKASLGMGYLHQWINGVLEWSRTE